ncbi:MarR family transcriptional regulator [Yinghuangia seranimata]|nr:MarR family transcriptional regulator [Yinghuangia seranimata]MDI2125358.1 MarR family transcriptional regulator [Yinghuangia seranimata]
MRAAGVTLSRGKLLKVVAHRGPCRMGGIAERLGIGPRSVTEAVDALERDGLVTRTPDPADRRAVLVSITDRGAEVLRAAEEPRREAVRGMFSTLTPDERAELLRLLGKVRSAAAGEDECCGRG